MEFNPRESLMSPIDWAVVGMQRKSNEMIERPRYNTRYLLPPALTHLVQ
jgi:hypothetical protein